MKNFNFMTAAVLIFSLHAPAMADQQQVGKQAYDQNCKACHSADRFSVGPSLVQIRKTYPKGKTQAFLNWTNNPGKKNPDTIQMPAMSHVGDDKLTAIHQYILLSTKFLKERKTKPKFTFKAPQRVYPNVKRAFMPFTSPASIAIALNEDMAIVWDTTKFTTRYAVPGKQNIFNGENKMEPIKKQIFYTETAANFWSIAKDNTFDFNGYRLKDGLPTFYYKIGKMEITEQIQSGHINKSFKRHYQITGLTEALVLDLNHQGQADIVASKGTITNNLLTLTPSQAKSFSIEVSFL
ncbi:cytochrome c [Paraglaciecola aquimarina]|uniref:Cytochrome c n=1 Tax=Paraglaciecola aquimarina TaxID=1235557 RepID=A0ABU3STT5_9ALTE|nr:cytochrome c [Paraglaciecola aquimarina]MDU0353388.1 cytochrome c [Paraglaciecola aquimarina]